MAGSILPGGPALAEAKAARPSSPTGVPARPLSGLPAYSHPEITAAHCRLVNSGRRDCVLPPMTAGRYIIKASGASMPIGSRPKQQLTIIVANKTCAQVIDITSWSGATRTINAVCDTSILSDTPILISIVYADLQALKNAAGPEVVILRAPWEGVLQARDATDRK